MLNTYLDLSTAYITPKDNDLLLATPIAHSDKDTSDYAVSLLSNYGYGFIMNVPDEKDALEHMRREGYDEDGLIKVMEYAMKNNAILIRLDCDGDGSIKELNSFKW